MINSVSILTIASAAFVAVSRLSTVSLDRVKRVVPQDSPHYFLSVSEDRTVRSHDLRQPHNCKARSCPSPLLKVPYRLSTLATSPLTPWLFAVAGEMPGAYLFDRRMIKQIRRDWGWGSGVYDEERSVQCVRRFGRAARAPGEKREETHVTGSRMAGSNGHEVGHVH